MRPCTLHSQKTGTTGTMSANPGTIFCRGAGENTCSGSMVCAVLGTIGTIGTMFSTYARARGCGVVGAVLIGMAKGAKHFLTRRSKTSSLSSLSSLKGGFPLKDQGLGQTVVLKKIVPKAGKIVPDVPKFGAGFQGVVGGGDVTTKSSERGAE